MDSHIDKLRELVTNCLSEESIASVNCALDYACRSYLQSAELCNDIFEETLQSLEPIIRTLSHKRAARLRFAINSLCFECECRAFKEGVYTGIRLILDILET